jgi:hypothetical protein
VLFGQVVVPVVDRLNALKGVLQRSAARAEAAAETVEDLTNEFMARFIQRERKRRKGVRQMLDADVLPRWAWIPRLGERTLG